MRFDPFHGTAAQPAASARGSIATHVGRRAAGKVPTRARSPEHAAQRLLSESAGGVEDAERQTGAVVETRRRRTLKHRKTVHPPPAPCRRRPEPLARATRARRGADPPPAAGPPPACRRVEREWWYAPERIGVDEAARPGRRPAGPRTPAALTSAMRPARSHGAWPSSSRAGRAGVLAPTRRFRALAALPLSTRCAPRNHHGHDQDSNGEPISSPAEEYSVQPTRRQRRHNGRQLSLPGRSRTRSPASLAPPARRRTT